MLFKKQHIDYVDLIARVLTNEAAAHEIEQLESWKKEHPSHIALFNAYADCWNATAGAKDIFQIDIDAEWSKMAAVIDNASDIVVPYRRPYRKMVHRVLSYAASLLLLFMLGVGIYKIAEQRSYNTLQTTSAPESFSLPDGTHITVNANSRVQYKKNFVSQNARKIKMQGQGHFAVARDDKHPFIIEAEDICIEVLGTTFYVNAIASENTVEVLLESGSVRVYRTDQEKEKYVLASGEKIVYSKQSKKFISSADLDVNSIAWHTRHFVFEGEKLEKVVEYLNHSYHTQIIIQSPAIRQCRLTATFSKQTLDAILHVISNSLDIGVKKSDNTIILTGSGC